MKTLNSSIKQAVDKAMDRNRESLFTQRKKVGAGDIPIPSSRELRGAEKQLKSIYAKELTYRDATRMANFARKLVTQAAKEKKDIPLRYALLEMAQEVGTKADACDVVWDVCARIDADFEVKDSAASIKSLCENASGQRGEGDHYLIDDPFDAKANLEAGLWFCFNAERWEEGLRLIIMSGDTEWGSVAEMEAANPQKASEGYELGREWDKLSARQKDKEKAYGAAKRAYHWYKKTETKLSGIEKETASKRIEMIEPDYPFAESKLKKLTAKDWERIPGKIIEVNANKINDAGISLSEGVSIRLVPHPTETWVHNYYGEKFVYKARGGPKYTYEPMRRGAMYMQADDGPMLKPGVITGPFKKLRLGKYAGSYSGRSGSGSIRVKVMLVEE